MPDKWTKCRSAHSCMRCWRNKMKHACPQSKAWLKKHEDDRVVAEPEIAVQGEDRESSNCACRRSKRKPTRSEYCETCDVLFYEPKEAKSPPSRNSRRARREERYEDMREELKGHGYSFPCGCVKRGKEQKVSEY